MKKFCCFSFIAFCLLSCSNQEVKLQKEIDSLRIVLKSKSDSLELVSSELKGFRINPERLLTQIKTAYNEKNETVMKLKYDSIIRFHPEAKEASLAQNILDQYEKEKEIEQKRKEAEAARQEALRKAKMAPIERLQEKYGCSEHEAKLILKHQVCRGMTSEMCRAAWGRPNDINRTVGSYGVHEQWCYDGYNYLYFEDGILTTIQN